MTTLGQLATLPNGFTYGQTIRSGERFYPILRWSGSDRREPDGFMLKDSSTTFGEHYVCHCKYDDSDPKTSYEATLNGNKYCFHMDTGPVSIRETNKGAYYECNVGETLCVAFDVPVLLDTIGFDHHKWGFYIKVGAFKKTSFPNQWRVNEFTLVIDYNGNKSIPYRIYGHAPFPEREYIPVTPYWVDPTTDVRWWEVFRKVYAAVMPVIKAHWREWAEDGDLVIIKPNEGFQPHTRPKLDGRYFMFGEPSYNSYLPQVLNVGPYMIMKEAAYKTAIDNMPKLNDNSISNAIEIMSFIWGVIHDHKVTIPDSISELVRDSWLGYRYSYSTTVLDGEEALKYISRTMARRCRDSSRPDWLTSYGASSYVFRNVPCSFRCALAFRDLTMEAYANAWDKLYELGLQPNLYVAWDLVPYSFVVDWALPIGDILSAMDTMGHVNSIKSRLSLPVYSLTYYRDTPEGNRVKCYTRWVGSAPSYLVGGVFAGQGPSQKTKYKRLADAVTLFS